MIVEAQSFKGDTFYWDSGNQGGTYKFNVYALDYARNLSATWSDTGPTDRTPATFSTDFPNSVALLDSAFQAAPASYRDFKTIFSVQAFKGDVFYWDSGNQGGTYSFYLYAFDYLRNLSLQWTSSGAVDQTPATFGTDFPNAIQLLDGPDF
jgi:hypothetical protein